MCPGYDVTACEDARVRRRALLATVALTTLALAACGSGTAARTVAALPAAPGSTAAHAAAKSLRLIRVASFNEPTYLTAPPGDPSRVFVLQRAGRVMLLLNGRKLAQPFLDITGSVYAKGSDEQGLLGIAFPADYATSGRFYVYYTVPGNDIKIVQFHRSATNPNVAQSGSARTVLTIDHHSFTNHNGGQLAFGREGDLYIGVGDGGSEGDPDGNGQNTGTLLAKILRVDPSPNGGYTIPASNPFAGQSVKRREIWAYGLRNPWRFSFDRTTGDMVIGDVGQDRWEELDFAAAGAGAGANYGWSVWEGDQRFKAGQAAHAVSPVLTASHSSGYCAIIGGYVVRDRSLPSLYGKYLFGDYCRAKIESVKLSRGRATGLRETGLEVPATSSFGQDARGHIYLVSLKGPVYRLAQR
jgi:glucose/arabinose dehydrogenase